VPLGFSFVDWSAPVSTLVGAMVGVGATMLADRSRWKRDQSRERIQLRRESYGSYLAAVIQAHEAMRVAAVAGGSSAENQLTTGRHDDGRASSRSGGAGPMTPFQCLRRNRISTVNDRPD
jgi:hypothetical protein